MFKLLDNAVKEKYPIVLVAEGIEQEALAPIIRNKLRGILKAAAIKAPAFGERKSHYLDDIAILTGGTVIRDDMGLTLEKAGKEEENDENYEEGEVVDVFDNDFDDDEPEPDEEVENEADDRFDFPKIMKLYVFEGALGAGRYSRLWWVYGFLSNLKGIVLDMAKSCTFPLPLLTVALQQLIAVYEPMLSRFANEGGLIGSSPAEVSKVTSGSTEKSQTQSEMFKLLDNAVKEKYPIVLVAEGIEQEALAPIIRNKLSILKAAAIKVSCLWESGRATTR
ncbi:hypothetical protein LOK49_LG13G00199 [Camellia lanceoleosa]|uniref:Uncharacterized protein n=1 Tax=Camellia lanceoleosa TaxID=1840588 RepID=A0ACC0FL37_9ERIC|nr:hypothetical protein LOK49_LG13G00199 [Camellia lanceoleosa]